MINNDNKSQSIAVIANSMTASFRIKTRINHVTQKNYNRGSKIRKYIYIHTHTQHTILRKRHTLVCSCNSISLESVWIFLFCPSNGKQFVVEISPHRLKSWHMSTWSSNKTIETEKYQTEKYLDNFYSRAGKKKRDNIVCFKIPLENHSRLNLY